MGSIDSALIAAQENIPGQNIKQRKMDFDLSSEAPHYWAGDPFRTAFFDAFSILFPEGERFVIDAVRLHAEKITQPLLREQARGFIGQEGQHALQHRHFNEILQRQGYNVAAWDAASKRLWNLFRKLMSPRQQLAMSCAIEHYTAILTGAFLASPETMRGTHGPYIPLWFWHAIEETEHKSVCFDVYRDTGGSYLRRILTMIVLTPLFLLRVTATVAYILAKDGLLFRFKVWWKGFQYLWGKPGVIRPTIATYFSYYLPNFHPWRHDNWNEVVAWKNAYENGTHEQYATEKWVPRERGGTAS